MKRACMTADNAAHEGIIITAADNLEAEQASADIYDISEYAFDVNKIYRRDDALSMAINFYGRFAALMGASAHQPHFI